MRALASLLLVVVLAGWSCAVAPPARLTAEQAEQLAQCNRWLQQANKHHRAGEIDQAIAAIHKGLALERSVFGQVQAGWLPWLMAQAELQEQRERFAEAITARQELLRRRQELHGLDDWRVTDARLDLQDTQKLARLDARQRQELRQAAQWNAEEFRLNQQGRSKEALPLAEKALATRRAILGEKDRLTALSWLNLGALHQALNRTAQALRCYQQALQVCKAALGEKHPHYADSLNNLARLYQAMGDHQAARPLLQQTLQVIKAALGEKHPTYATSLNNLAWLYKDMGDHKAALPLYKQALQVCKTALGEKHPHYATSLNNLAGLHQGMKQHKQAQQLNEQALAITRANLLLAASIQSERQQLAATRAVRHHLDFRLSLPDAEKEGAAGSYQYVLAWKGAVFLHQQQRRHFARLRAADSASEVRSLLEQLQQTTRLLAALTLAPVEPRTAAARRQQAEKLTQHKEDLESQLSRLSRTFRDQQKQADLTAALLQQTLPADTALIDFLF
jgi:tetratricopeptide (TPR) repeat protein